jgi:hypothetical protein
MLVGVYVSIVVRTTGHAGMTPIQTAAGFHVSLIYVLLVFQSPLLEAEDKGDQGK